MSATEKALAAAEVEIVAKATRRRFTVEYKRRILREADGCKTPGAVGALLRREGLYSSHLTTWRAAQDRGSWRESPRNAARSRRCLTRGTRRSPSWRGKKRDGAGAQSGLRRWSRSKKTRRCWRRRA